MVLNCGHCVDHFWFVRVDHTVTWRYTGLIIAPLVDRCSTHVMRVN